jgi:hypothetical protein
MNPPQALPRSAWSLAPLLIVNWIAFANVLSASGVLLWVIIPSLIGVQMMLIMIRAERRILAGVALFGLSALAVGLSDVIGGTTSGPITRSTLMMTTCAGLMVLLWRTGVPASAAVVSLGALAGALGLGAADRIVWWVGLWVVAVAVYLAAVGPLRTDDLRGRSRLQGFALMLLTAGLLASLAGNALQTVMRDAWTITGGTVVGAQTNSGAPVRAGQQPDAVEEILVTVAGAEPDVAAQEEPGTRADSRPVEPTAQPVEPDAVEGTAEAESRRGSFKTVLLMAAFLLYCLLLLLAIALADVHLAWVMLRRSLRKGTPAQQVRGAWLWLRLQWARSGYVEHAHRTPDSIARHVDTSDDVLLRDLAELATHAIYAHAPDIDAAQARQAWSMARSLRKQAPRSWPTRMRALLTAPSAAEKRLAASQQAPRMEAVAMTPSVH